MPSRVHSVLATPTPKTPAAAAAAAAATTTTTTTTATAGRDAPSSAIKQRVLATVSVQEDQLPFPVGQVVKVGTRVKFIGTITKDYGDGTYDIVYQDGKRDFDIPHALISAYSSTGADGASGRASRSNSIVSVGPAADSRTVDRIDIEDAVSEEWASIGKAVAAGSKLEVGPLKITRPGALVEWKFAVVNGDDIEFCVLFADGKHVPEVVVDEALYTGVGRGKLFVTEAGEVILRWSNFFSFIAAKQVRYRVRLTYPDAGESRQRREQIELELQEARNQLTALRQIPQTGRQSSGLRALKEQAAEAAAAQQAAQEQLQILRRQRMTLRKRSIRLVLEACTEYIVPFLFEPALPPGPREKVHGAQRGSTVPSGLEGFEALLRACDDDEYVQPPDEIVWETHVPPMPAPSQRQQF